MIQCPSCQFSYPTASAYCPQCGATARPAGTGDDAGQSPQRQGLPPQAGGPSQPAAPVARPAPYPGAQQPPSPAPAGPPAYRLPENTPGPPVAGANFRDAFTAGNTGGSNLDVGKPTLGGWAPRPPAGSSAPAPMPVAATPEPTPPPPGQPGLLPHGAPAIAAWGAPAPAPAPAPPGLSPPSGPPPPTSPVGGAPAYTPMAPIYHPPAMATPAPVAAPRRPTSMLWWLGAAALLIAAGVVGYVAFVRPTASTAGIPATSASPGVAGVSLAASPPPASSPGATAAPPGPGAGSIPLTVSFTDPQHLFTASFPAQPIQQSQQVPLGTTNETLYMYITEAADSSGAQVVYGAGYCHLPSSMVSQATPAQMVEAFTVGVGASNVVPGLHDGAPDATFTVVKNGATINGLVAVQGSTLYYAFVGASGTTDTSTTFNQFVQDLTFTG